MIIAVGLLFTTISDYTMALLIGRNKTGSVMRIGTGVAILELAMLFVLIPFFKGYALVAIASLVTPLLTFSFYYRAAARDLGVRISGGRIGRVAAAAIICMAAAVPILLFLPGGTFANDLAMVAVAAAEQLLLYPVVVARLKGVERRDLGILRGISANIPILGKVMTLMTDYAEFAMGPAPRA
jgi:O-antigen/teichoic acid export membrane protein